LFFVLFGWDFFCVISVYVVLWVIDVFCDVWMVYFWVWGRGSRGRFWLFFIFCGLFFMLFSLDYVFTISLFLNFFCFLGGGVGGGGGGGGGWGEGGFLGFHHTLYYWFCYCFFIDFSCCEAGGRGGRGGGGGGGMTRVGGVGVGGYRFVLVFLWLVV